MKALEDHPISISINTFILQFLQLFEGLQFLQLFYVFA